MRRACVIGWPIEHSRSPAIHGYWLNRYGIDGSYTKEAVPPGKLEGFLEVARDQQLSRMQRHHPSQGGGAPHRR